MGPTSADGASTKDPEHRSTRPRVVGLLAALAFLTALFWLANSLGLLLTRLANSGGEGSAVPILLPYLRREVGVLRIAVVPVLGLPLLVTGIGLALLALVIGLRLRALTRGAWWQYLAAAWGGWVLFLFPVFASGAGRFSLALANVYLRQRGLGEAGFVVLTTALLLLLVVLVFSSVALVRLRSLFTG